MIFRQLPGSIITEIEEQTLEFGRMVGNCCFPGTVVTLDGPLGSGKTIIAKGIAEALGVEEPVTSPTFTIIQDYDGSIPLRHIDLYRIRSEEEFDLLGGAELFDESRVTIIEWGSLIASLLPPEAIRIDIVPDPGDRRTIFLHLPLEGNSNS